VRLRDCVLETTHTIAVARPPILTAPEAEWTAARDAALIPEHLYRFYCVADYFSLNKAPRFLNDPERILFSFLAGLTRGLRDNLEEAHELVDMIRKDQGKGYSPIKEMRGETWDQQADVRQRRSFRYLIVSLSSAVDQFAEIVSIFFHGEVENLTVGRASFTKLVEVVRKPFNLTGIVSPKQARFEELHAILAEETVGTAEEEHWFEVFQLYRNKLAHLGFLMFPIIVFNDKKGEFFSFTPNRWPLFLESHMHIRQAGDKKNPDKLRKFAEECFVHDDIVEYAAGLLLRVQCLLDRGFRVLCATYADFRDFDFNASALRSLKDKKQTYNFRAFRHSSV